MPIPDSFMHSQVSRTYRLAISKALRETLEYVQGESEDSTAAYNILNKLISDDDTPALPIKFIEEKLEHYQRKRQEMYEGFQSSTVEQLTVTKGPVKDEL